MPRTATLSPANRAHFLTTARDALDLAARPEVAAAWSAEYPEPVIRAVLDVLDVLTTVAVRRHGQTAVLRALSRPQRAPGDVSAF